MEGRIVWVVGLVVTGGLWLLINPAWEQAARRAARRRGQAYVDAFPQVHGSEREAKYDEARQKGLL
jgi:hypothetical protein